MGSIIYTSHRYQALVEIFCDRIKHEFDKFGVHQCTVAVPNHTVANWLSTQIADFFGVCLNIHFVYLDSLINENDSSASVEDAQLIWALDLLSIVHESEDLIGESFTESAALSYAWEFSSVLRKLVEYRGEWLINWENTPELPLNWRFFYERCWNQIQSRGHEDKDPLYAAYKVFEGYQLSEKKDYPIHLFGFWEINPLRWNLLHRIYSGSEIITYLPLPSVTYLGDLNKSGLQIPLFSEDEQIILNPRLKLLSKLIGRGRGFQSFLLDQDVHMETLPYKATPPKTTLSLLQSLFINPEKSFKLKHAFNRDSSIQLHSCTSKKRELEVVKTIIQQAILDFPNMKLEDIHVYAPNILEYADWIPVVFSEQEAGDKISISLKEPLEIEQISTFKTILKLLNLMSSNWSASDVMDLLMLPAIQDQFTFDSSSIDNLKEWIHTHALFGGIGKSEFNFDQPHSFYSWESGISRLIESYTTGSDPLEKNVFFQSPKDQPDLLERFVTFLRTLISYKKKFEANSDALKTLDTINNLVSDFIPNEFHTYEQSALRKALTSIKESIETQIEPKLSFKDIVQIIRKKLPQLPPPNTLNRKGGILFQSIRFEEMIPGKVKILMGIEDGSFPGNDPQRSFDLLQLTDSRFGDPAKRDCDLYWFLQSIVLTEKRWCSTFLGQDEFSHEIKPMSPLLESLSDTVNRILPEFAGITKTEEWLPVIQQSRFSYESACYSSDSGKRHFNLHAFQAASNLIHNPKPSDFLSESKYQTSDFSDSGIISLKELLEFFTHPARYFCRYVAKIKIEDPSWLQEEEFEPSLWDNAYLRNYQAKSYALNENLNQTQTDFSQLINEGLLPFGLLGEKEWQSYCEHWQLKIQELNKDYSVGLSSDQINANNLEIDRFQFVVPALKQPQKDLAFIQASKLKKSSEIRFWIYSLSLFAGNSNDFIKSTTLFTSEKKIRFDYQPLAKQILTKLISIWRSYRDRYMPFFPECSYVAYKYKKSSIELVEHYKWASSQFGKGEYEDRYNRLLVPANGNPFNSEFYEISDKIYALMENPLSALEEGPK